MNALDNSPVRTLAEEQQAASQLLALLLQEQAQLVDAQIESLDRITQDKAGVLGRMTELARERHRALGAAGFDATETGMLDWVNSPLATAEATKSWTDLLALAKSAKDLNRTNGLLINRHMARNQNALNVLQGTPQGGNFYGPNGQATTKTVSRGFVVG